MTSLDQVQAPKTAAVPELYKTGTGTRKVAKVAERLGVPNMPENQVSTIAA